MKPPVTGAEAQDDFGWFKGTRRRYRLRRSGAGGWLIRRRAGRVYLRFWVPSLPGEIADNDEVIRPFWFTAAWPDLPAKQCSAMIIQSRQLEKS